MASSPVLSPASSKSIVRLATVSELSGRQGPVCPPVRGPGVQQVQRGVVQSGSYHPKSGEASAEEPGPPDRDDEHLLVAGTSVVCDALELALFGTARTRHE